MAVSQFCSSSLLTAPTYSLWREIQWLWITLQPHPWLQAIQTRYSAAFGIDPDILYQRPSELRNNFPLKGAHSRDFPVDLHLSVTSQSASSCPFPFSSDFAWVQESTTDCPFQVHSLCPSFLQPCPWSSSTLLPCIFSTTRSFQMGIKQTPRPRFACILILRINRGKGLQEFHVDHKTHLWGKPVSS